MPNANDLRRMAGKLRTLAIGQDEKILIGLTEAADRYEAEAEALERGPANLSTFLRARAGRHRYA